MVAGETEREATRVAAVRTLASVTAEEQMMAAQKRGRKKAPGREILGITIKTIKQLLCTRADV
jgi:hypothetical protein